MDNIIDKVKIIAVYRVLFVKSVWELEKLRGNVTQIRGNAVFAINGVYFFCSSLGLDVTEIDVNPAGSNWLNPVLHFRENCFTHDRLAQDIEFAYGLSARRVFELAQYITIISYVSSLLEHFSDGEYGEHLNNQSRQAVELFYEFAKLWDMSKYEASLLGNEAAREMNLLTDLIVKEFIQNQDNYRQVHLFASKTINKLAPIVEEMGNRAVRSVQLLSELKACKPGIKNWKDYEDICIKIIKFLFIPPFRTVLVQARTSDGHERRDAVLPNNQYTDFWSAIRQEFESKNIVCEFKNIGTKPDKSLLNQLRIYLSKPTVGRFGLLFRSCLAQRRG